MTPPLLGVLVVLLVARILWLHRRLTALRHQVDEAAHQASHDALTGLLNRTGLRQQWIPRVSTCPVVAVADLDGFKPVNDRYGHAAGDQVLSVVAARLRDLVTDPVRLGGDEFALLLPAHTAENRARRIAARIADPIRLPDGSTVVVSASIGLSTPGRDLPALLAEADAAMYRAKTTRAGIAVHHPRADDRVTLAADPRPTIRVRDLPAECPIVPAGEWAV